MLRARIPQVHADFTSAHLRCGDLELSWDRNHGHGGLEHVRVHGVLRVIRTVLGTEHPIDEPAPIVIHATIGDLEAFADRLLLQAAEAKREIAAAVAGKEDRS